MPRTPFSAGQQTRKLHSFWSTLGLMHAQLRTPGLPARSETDPHRQRPEICLQICVCADGRRTRPVQRARCDMQGGAQTTLAETKRRNGKGRSIPSPSRPGTKVPLEARSRGRRRLKAAARLDVGWWDRHIRPRQAMRPAFSIHFERPHHPHSSIHPQVYDVVPKIFTLPPPP